MDRPITVWLPDSDYASVATEAARYGRTTEEQVVIWIHEPLAEARRRFSSDRWEQRRKALEADPELAATVDAATVKR